MSADDPIERVRWWPADEPVPPPSLRESGNFRKHGDIKGGLRAPGVLRGRAAMVAAAAPQAT